MNPGAGPQNAYTMSGENRPKMVQNTPKTPVFVHFDLTFGHVDIGLPAALVKILPVSLP